MAQILVGNLEARAILTATVKDEPRPEVGLGTRVAALFSECGLDEPIPELRGHLIEPMDFDE